MDSGSDYPYRKKPQSANSVPAPQTAQDMVQKGIELRSRGALSWQEAENLFRRAVEESPDYAEGHYQLASIWIGGLRNRHNVPGWNYLTPKSVSDIDSVLQKVIQLDPTHSGPHYCYACLACYPPESYSIAVKKYTEAVRLDTKRDPQYHIYHLDVAMLASNQHDEDLAVEAFKRCFESDPEYYRTCPSIEPAYTFWRMAFYQIYKRDPDDPRYFSLF